VTGIQAGLRPTGRGLGPARARGGLVTVTVTVTVTVRLAAGARRAPRRPCTPAAVRGRPGAAQPQAQAEPVGGLVLVPSRARRRLRRAESLPGHGGLRAAGGP
jgi:hypothetical protein